MTKLTLTILLLVLPFTAYAEEALFTSREKEEGVVAEVKETDFIILEGGQRIQLIGIQTDPLPKPKRLMTSEYGRVEIVPEIEDPTKSIDQQSFEFTRDLLEGKKVRLEYDQQKRDDEWHIFAYVFLEDGVMANTEILRQGFARLNIVPPNVKYADQLREAYQESRREKRGFQGE